MNTLCGHTTNRNIRVCKSCMSDYILGVLPIYDGLNEPWRKKAKVQYERKTSKCIDCGMPIRPKHTRCLKCSSRYSISIRNKKRGARCSVRDGEIVQRHEGGWTQKRLAEEYRLSVSRVNAILLKARKEKDNG